METIKRNYGNFSDAVQKIMPELVAALGYEHRGGSFFARARENWLEGFELVQSDWPGGDFFILIHLQVPGLATRWRERDASHRGRCIGSHLGERGVDQRDAWLPAADRQQLEESLATAVKWLYGAEPWFADFQCSSDLARIYRSRSTLVEAGSNSWWQCVEAATYGFLLAEAGELSQARAWLREAERLMRLPLYLVPGSGFGIVHEKVEGAQEVFKHNRGSLRDLAVVRRALKDLEAAANTE